MWMQTHHAVLAMWLIINQVEFESFQITSTCCTLEAIDMPVKQIKKGKTQSMLNFGIVLQQTRQRC